MKTDAMCKRCKLPFRRWGIAWMAESMGGPWYLQAPRRLVRGVTMCTKCFLDSWS